MRKNGEELQFVREIIGKPNGKVIFSMKPYYRNSNE